MMRKTVLFVDDERYILTGLRRLLYPLQEDWEMLFVESGAEALQVMQNKKVSVLITDMRMPSMNGFQLLQTVQKNNPEIIRVMLTGQADKSIYSEVMTLCHYFFWKPTKFGDFESLFGRIKSLDAALPNRKLDQLLGGISSLPSLPELFVRLTVLLEQAETDCAKIAGVIREDIPMADQVQKLVNSSFVGLERKIATLEQAVTELGVNRIRSLVLAQHLFSQCGRQEFQEFRLDQLMEHSFRVATLAGKIASDANNAPRIQEDAYLAGLLHDIGKLILIRCLPDSYRQIRAEVCRTGRPRREVEMELLGADHATISGYLISLWGLPQTITEAVTLHHVSPPEGLHSVSPVSAAVFKANSSCPDLSDNST